MDLDESFVALAAGVAGGHPGYCGSGIVGTPWHCCVRDRVEISKSGTPVNLRAPHYGYAYQDLVTGIALVDLVLGVADRVTVDEKEFSGDRFDDLTIEYRSGRRTRIQIKHTSEDRELAKKSFSADGRGLRIDLLFRSLLDDLDQHPGTTYRLVVRDGDPDDDLAKVLKPADPEQDPGDPLPTFATRRFRFDDYLLRTSKPWQKRLESLDEDQVRRACEQLVVDTAAPAATLDVTAPGAAERVLLLRASEELGAGRTPNASVSPEHVARALAQAATGSRARDGLISRDRLLPQLGLVTDFGAVAEGHPVDPAISVHRADAVTAVCEQIDAVATTGGRVVVTGEPGVGKSWLTEQVADRRRDADWVVARHHCWLGSGEADRDLRVLTEVVIGSLLRQLEQQVPEATANLRPRFASTPEALAAAVQSCLATGRRVLLVVDGLDHVDRVLGRKTNQLADPSRLLVGQLITVALPPGACLLVASQPGEHLEGAVAATDRQLQVPRMSWDELRALVRKHELLSALTADDLLDTDDERSIVDLIDQRSHGNALYATYLCRHASRTSPLDDGVTSAATVKDLVHRLTLIPATATTVEAYYDHLLDAMTPDQELAIGALAVCDFAMSAAELGEMLSPQVRPLLTTALRTLAPVLTSQPGLGGLRIHHESFSRHILRDKGEDWVESVCDDAAKWLAARGFYADARSFRHLPGLLVQLDRYDDLVALVQPGFVAEAIRALQPPEALVQVLRIVARESALRLDWPTLITCVETRKSVDTYESESLTDSVVEYADVIVSLLGVAVVAERLVYDGLPTFPPRWGLQLCLAVDRAGGAAPWAIYLKTWEADSDRTRYGSDSDKAVHLGAQLGHLRLRGQRNDFAADFVEQLAAHLDDDEEVPSDDLVDVFAAGMPSGAMPAVAAAVKTPGVAAAIYLRLADLSAAGTPGLPAAQVLAREALTRAPTLDIARYLNHGVPVPDLLAALGSDVEKLTADLLDVTDRVVSPSDRHIADLEGWLGLLALAHAADRAVLLKVAGKLTGPGFYRAWLRYVVATVGVARDVASSVLTPAAASSAVRVALEDLAAEATAFVGNPRACDLYFVHPLIHRTVEHTLVVVRPEDLDAVLDRLLAIGDGTTTTTNFGLPENGPLKTNDLLGLLARVSGQIGADLVHALTGPIRDRRDDSYTMYRDMADFELAIARICDTAGAEDEARDCWQRAASLLASYGGHKDPTMAEIIESVADLADLDIGTARTALARLLDLPYLVRQHTNGRGTSHFVNSWWEKAAAVDPVAAGLDGADTQLASVGLPDSRVLGVHERLLEGQVATADPFVLAALRLTVDGSWRRVDVDQLLLQRLQGRLGITGTDAMIAVVADNVAASYDDQPRMYSDTHAKSVATDELVDAVVRLGGTTFDTRSPTAAEDRATVREFAGQPVRRSLLHSLVLHQRPHAPVGRSGALVAARQHAKQTYREEAIVQWDSATFADAIGWRVLEVSLNEGAEAGTRLLDDIVRELSVLTDHEFLVLVGAGLALRCDDQYPELKVVASYCLALAFIRVRGGGGWRSFAGRDRVELWTEAYGLDPATATRVLAAAVADTAGSDVYGTYGVTQAVIAALAAIPGDGSRAWPCWEAAFSVIQHRLPGTARRDGHVYRPTDGQNADGDVDQALATLAVAAIARPSRDDLRRVLLATAMLVARRPEIGQAAVCRVLRSTLDAGRTTWLLEILMSRLPAGAMTDDTAAELARLAGSEWLSARALAGRVLEEHSKPVPAPPANEPDPKIRGGATPPRSEDETEGPTDHEWAERLVAEFLDQRLGEMSGLHAAVVDRTAARMEEIGRQVGLQLEYLRSTSSRRIPDAYLADEAEIENELQASAGGMRAAVAIDGTISAPLQFERRLARHLTSSAMWALLGQASRIPRPTTRAAELSWSIPVVPWLDDDTAWPPVETEVLVREGQFTGEDRRPPRVAEGPCQGWVQLGLIERQRTLATRYPNVRPARELLIVTGAAIGGPGPEGNLPLSGARPRVWTEDGRRRRHADDAELLRSALAADRGPLAALVSHGKEPRSAAAERGAGLPLFTLAPDLLIATLFGLRPGAGEIRHVLVDDDGPAIVGRCWHGGLIHGGDYETLIPAVHGADVLIRPDLYEALENIVGRDRISLEVFVNVSENEPS
jgi:hypothetical protein